MTDDTAAKKWNKIYSSKKSPEQFPEPRAASVLLDHSYLLPGSGVALDLACGFAGNAIFLEKYGMQVHAWDVSATVIDKVNAYASENNISIATEVRDIEKNPPTKHSFDVICVSYYLERAIVSDISAALKPNGILFYQTFINEKVSDDGPSNPKYRLQPNELLTMFSSLHILAYKEYGRVGNIKMGLRDVATLVAQNR